MKIRLLYDCLHHVQFHSTDPICTCNGYCVAEKKDRVMVVG